MKDEQMRAVLVDARRRIDRGWLQGHAKSGSKVCAGQALTEALYMNNLSPEPDLNSYTNGDYQDAERYLLSIVHKVEGRVYPSVPVWNDSPWTTKRNVLSVFSEAIRRLGPSPVIEVKVTAPAEEKVYVPAEWNKIIIPVEAPVETTTRWEKIKALVGV